MVFLLLVNISSLNLDYQKTLKLKSLIQTEREREKERYIEIEKERKSGRGREKDIYICTERERRDMREREIKRKRERWRERKKSFYWSLTVAEFLINYTLGLTSLGRKIFYDFYFKMLCLTLTAASTFVISEKKATTNIYISTQHVCHDYVIHPLA